MSFQSRESRVGRIIQRVSVGLAAVFALVALLGFAAYVWVRASLPLMDGEAPVAGLRQAVKLTRDAAGIANIHAADVLDAVRALGFVHAQERFFEMDLSRRSAAGELSALVGSATLPMDRDKRRHRMRARATAEWERAPEIEKAWLVAYAEGVNAGLSALGARPWQYLLLRSKPEPWQPVDSLLVVSEMYFMLQGWDVESRYADIRLRKLLGDTLFDWVRPSGGHWDATLDGVVPPAIAMPGPDLIDTRRVAAPKTSATDADVGMTAELLDSSLRERLIPGSNNWAASGARTRDGRAILANDMHLHLSTPGIWFRAEMTFKHDGRDYRAVGLTLPGVPQLVSGSNGFIAWGFTNTQGQWFDWVKVPKASTAMKTVNEVIAVKGGESETLVVRELPFGPVLNSDDTSYYGLDWALYRPGALIERVDAMMLATNVDEAIARARNMPMPHQNLMVVDSQGQIAWTLIGRAPDREGWATKPGLPRTSATMTKDWIASDRVPVIKNPKEGLLWTANSRPLGGAGSDVIGDGGFDLGARSTQIRDRLRETPVHDESSFHRIQLDTEARFLKRWASLIEARASAPNAPPAVIAIHAEIKRWNGRADADQFGHYLVWNFRNIVLNVCWREWLATQKYDLVAAYKSGSREKGDAALERGHGFEYAVWQALTSRPAHLLPKGHASWDEFLDNRLIRMHDFIIKREGSLSKTPWGTLNQSGLRHRMSQALPLLSAYLDMPTYPQAGDNHMPLVADRNFGASQRLVVSPGKEADATLTVAGGQSGHPLSPFYGAGHREWAQGERQPLLAGEAKHVLKLVAR